MEILSREVDISGIGLVKLKKSRLYRYLKISVAPFKGVRVLVPYPVSLAEAERFVHTKREWIQKTLDKVRQTEARRIVFDFSSVYQTNQHKLKLKADSGKTIRIAVKEGIIHVFIPERATVYDENVQKAIRFAISETWRIEAKRLLPGRVEELASQFGFTYNNLAIKDIKSRWGSCSSSNNINLSIYLMKLPESLRDYVILHELVHTVHKNHGRGFWEALTSVNSKARELDKALGSFAPGV